MKTYRAMVEFAIDYELKDGVADQAITRAIRNAPIVTVHKLQAAFDPTWIDVRQGGVLEGG